MKQALLLPHQTLGCLAAAGKMHLIAGEQVPLLEHRDQNTS